MNSNYLNKNIPFIKEKITEYDLKEAGFSVIKKYKLLSQEVISELNLLDKKERNIAIGKLRKDDNTLSNGIRDGIKNSVKALIEENKVEKEKILSIKNDAVFIMGNTLCSKLEFEGVYFKIDNNYTSYHYLNEKEFYYNSIQNILHTKGFNNKIIEMHSPFFLNFLQEYFRQFEYLDSLVVLSYLKKFREKYLTRSLNTEYYRELNGFNSFKLLNRSGVYYKDQISENYLHNIDITFNYIKYIIPIINNLL